jgi:hypothetical protein
METVELVIQLSKLVGGAIGLFLLWKIYRK